MQASVPLIHPCYDKRGLKRWFGHPLQAKRSIVQRRSWTGSQEKEKNLHLASAQGFQISI